MDDVKSGKIERFSAIQDKFGARPIDANQPLARVQIHTYGEVALLSTYSSDEGIVETARVSYGKGTSAVRDTRNLIRYLMRHRHTSPFEHAELTFYLRLPIFVMRQLIRHRTANVNEYSARYSELSNDFYVPEVEAIARQSTANKQGRGEKLTLQEAETVQQLFVNAQENAVRSYRELLDQHGVARELARIPTSVGMYTEAYWKCDLHNFMHMLKLRMDAHAQQEIRDFAVAMYECAFNYFPITFEAFDTYILSSYTLSRNEIRMLSEIFSQFKAELHARRWPEGRYHGMSDREAVDFHRFLDTLLS